MADTGESVSQSVTTTLLARSSWTTHTLLFFYFEYGDYPCKVAFFSLFCLLSGEVCNFPVYGDESVLPPEAVLRAKL